MKQTPKMLPGTYTTYDVLSFVKQVLKEEPKRVYMNHWIAYLTGRQIPYELEEEIPLPECGTVACLAGWICVVTGQDSFVSLVSGTLAMSVLGLVEGPAREALHSLFWKTQYIAEQVDEALGEYLEEYKDSLQQIIVEVS